MTATDLSGTLTERQRAAAHRLALTGSYATAARAGRCSERTLRRWRAVPEFRAAVTDASRASAADARDVLTALQMQAARTLRRAMADDNANVRVRAARAVLETAARLAEHDVWERLEELEKRLQEREPWSA